jgi:Ca2+-transporting ATPase
VIQRFGVEARLGLNRDEVEQRTRRYGANAIQEQRRRSLERMFLDQCTDFMIRVLMAAAIISGLIGDPIDPVAIVVIIVLNGVIGFVQEYRAERAVAALKQLAAPHMTRTRSCPLPAAGRTAL